MCDAADAQASLKQQVAHLCITEPDGKFHKGLQLQHASFQGARNEILRPDGDANTLTPVEAWSASVASTTMRFESGRKPASGQVVSVYLE